MTAEEIIGTAVVIVLCGVMGWLTVQAIRASDEKRRRDEKDPWP